MFILQLSELYNSEVTLSPSDEIQRRMLHK